MGEGRGRSGVARFGPLQKATILIPIKFWRTFLSGQKTCKPDNREELALFLGGAKHLVSWRPPNSSRPNLHQVAQVDQECMWIVGKQWNRSPGTVQLGFQPVRSAPPQEGEAVVVGVLGIEYLGARLAVRLVSSQS